MTKSKKLLPAALDREITAAMNFAMRAIARDLYGTPFSMHPYFDANENLGKHLVYRVMKKELDDDGE